MRLPGAVGPGSMPPLRGWRHVGLWRGVLVPGRLRWRPRSRAVSAVHVDHAFLHLPPRRASARLRRAAERGLPVGYLLRRRPDGRLRPGGRGRRVRGALRTDRVLRSEHADVRDLLRPEPAELTRGDRPNPGRLSTTRSPVAPRPVATNDPCCEPRRSAQRKAGITASAKRRAGTRVSRPKNSITKNVQPAATRRRSRSTTVSGVPARPFSSLPAPMWPP